MAVLRTGISQLPASGCHFQAANFHILSVLLLSIPALCFASMRCNSIRCVYLIVTAQINWCAKLLFAGDYHSVPSTAKLPILQFNCSTCLACPSPNCILDLLYRYQNIVLCRANIFVYISFIFSFFFSFGIVWIFVRRCAALSLDANAK